LAGREAAEEVVQDTWLAVIEGIGGFEGRSALKTWIVRILINKARRRARNEGRRVDFLPLPSSEAPAPVGADRFWWIGRWRVAPAWWDEDTPERLVLAGETVQMIENGLAALPASQRAVVILRDVEGLSAAEACNVLEISDTNQRVLLHRGRSRLRTLLESYLDGAHHRR
jgi:RNA polymerase sigma-70 factor (ECF subfamily)